MSFERISHSTLEWSHHDDAHIVDPGRLLGEPLAEASPDLMRSLLQTMINALLFADADAAWSEFLADLSHAA